MRISFVIGTLHVGGAEKQLVGLATRLVQRGYEVEVIALDDGGPLEGELRDHGVEVHVFRPTGVVANTRLKYLVLVAKTAARLWSHWGPRPPDVVSAWLPGAQIVGLPIAWARRVPVRILALRSKRDAVAGGPLLSIGMALARAAATAATANALAVADDAGWRIGRLPCTVIPNGVYVPSRQADPAKEPPTGVMVANLIAYKGHADVLRALSLCETRPRMRFVGRGHMRPALERLAEDLGVSTGVEFHDDVNDPTQLLLEAQFAVLASHTEGMPNAVLEYMAAGLPVIATNVGGVPELIHEGWNGILVAPGQPSELARSIDRVVRDPDWRGAAGNSSRATAESFTWDAVVGSFVLLFSGKPEASRHDGGRHLAADSG